MFRLVALVLPVILLALAELGLRLAGLGGYPAMFMRVGPLPGGQLVIADQGGAASWFFASPERAGRNEQYAFLDPKPTNTVRIFCVGESAMQGFPQPRHLASSAFLQTMLKDVWPARKVEVINLGTTAVASFPVLGILTEVLEFQPDLVIIYTGNNEFFGTYGVASAGRAGSRPWMLRVNRFVHSLALVQGLQQLLHLDESDFNRTLMEEMMAQTYIGPDDWRRRAAADNLHDNISEMIKRCRPRGVPALICTLPCNERDLAPIGNDKLDGLPPGLRAEIESLVSRADADLAANHFESALAACQKVLTLDPKHARAHFLLGQAQARHGNQREARDAFTAARDLDTMPWRPPSQSQDAVLRAARDQAAPVCDLLKAFRAASPGGIIGWELMDDHVHPSLRGQALIAETILDSLTNITGGLQVSASTRAALPPWTEYARRLGENIYDRFGTECRMRSLFNAPFMRVHNSQAFARFDEMARAIESPMPKELRATLSEWQDTQPFAGSRCPVTAAVAQWHLKRDEYQPALELYEIALRAVPQYTSWFLEYTYYVLYCGQKLHGPLGSGEKARARAAIEQGHFLSRYARSETRFTERYTGLLHVLCGEYPEAIPYLAACRERQTDFDRVVVDQTLALCYLQTRETGKARELLTAGAAGAGKYAELYASLLKQLPALERSLAEKTNSPSRPVN